MRYAAAMTNPPSRVVRRGPYAKSTERRRSIVEAAYTVFVSRGYQNGSLQDVANLVGMSQTSLLHYFPTKSHLLLAVLNRRDSVARDGSPPPADETMVESVLRQAAFNETHPGMIELYTILSAESLTADHPGRGFFVDRFTSLRQTYAAGFAELAARGRLRPGVDPVRAATGLVALWDGLQLQWLYAPGELDVVAVLGDYLDLLILPGE
jgi:AcrR family transcriptional regulator